MSTSPASSRWLKCISTEGNIRGVAIQATDLVRSMVKMHGLHGIGAQALGEAVIGAILIASYCKDKERINLNIRGSKEIFQALVDAHPDGTVRGYVVQKQVELPDDGIVFEDPRQGPWGEGVLSVLRTKNQEREQPYIGTVPLVTGHLAKDLTFYWMQSEQVPSAVGIAVKMEGDQVIAAGGFLVQALPGASDKEVKLIDDHIQEMQSLAQQIAVNSDPLAILSTIFQDTAFVILEEKPLEFKCTCSWERVRKALTLVGTAELSAMLKEDKAASVRCDFCAKEYRADAAELQKLIEAAREREGG